MISDVARHKLLVLSGQCSENTGELILQSGSFSFFSFIDIFTDQEVGKIFEEFLTITQKTRAARCEENSQFAILVINIVMTV